MAATDGASVLVSALLYVSGCVRGVCAVTTIGIEEQQHISSNRATVFQVLAFVPVVTVYVCVVGAQQDIEL